MKRSQALAAYSAIMGVKLNKMSEEMTEAILADTLAFASVNEQFEKVRDELRKRTIDTIEQERRESYDGLITKRDALSGKDRAALQAVINDNFADILKAQSAFVKALNKWLDKDVELDIEKVERKDFINAVKESGQDITPASLAEISILFNGAETVETKIDEAELDNLLSE